jgi:exodeoxyribonuclease (lambda-induced)
MTISDFPQGSPEWLKARAGKITASNAWKIVDRTAKGLPTADHTNFKFSLVTERLTGEAAPTFVNEAMRHGTNTEPEARAFFATLYDACVEEVGFITHPEFDFMGCSPDGIIGGDTLLEIKCLTTKSHLEMLLSRAPQKDHVLQCQYQMLITGATLAHLLYYDPRLPLELQSKVFSLEADIEVQNQLRDAAIALDLEVDTIIQQLKESI